MSIQIIFQFSTVDGDFCVSFSIDAFFLHEGNQTYVEGLVNFEKMVGGLFDVHQQTSC